MHNYETIIKFNMRIFQAKCLLHVV